MWLVIGLVLVGVVIITAVILVARYERKLREGNKHYSDIAPCK